jgi:hypothetical protein
MAEDTTNNAPDTAQDNTNADQTPAQQTPATEEPQDKGFAGGEGKSEGEGETKEPEGFEDGKDSKDGEGDKEVDKDADADKAEGAPETYEKFELEEGFDMTDDEHNMASEVFKELGLSQPKAQRIIKLKQDFDKARDADLAKNQKEETVAWQKETRKELGDNYKEQIKKGKKAHDTFMPEAFKDFLVKTGLVHHPDYIRGMIKIGESISEDTFVNSENKVGKEETFGKYSDILEQNPNLGKR